MMQGVVNELNEATLPLVIGNTEGKRQLINAVIDTGFNGFLTLPSSIITNLNLPWNASEIVTLGDGKKTIFDVYAVMIIWDGEYREIDVAESETEPLIGMSLLSGYQLQVEVKQGGIVSVQKL